MEISQGNSLCFLYLKQAKMSFFIFFFPLLQNQRIGGWNRSSSGGWLVLVGGGRWQGKGVGGWIWCKKCVHMYENAKMMPVETVPGMGQGSR
jgi:hypothetical protein